MAAAPPLRRQEATYLDGTWGWGKEDPETGEDLYNISSVVRTPMAFEEEAWDKPQHRYTWEQVRAMERAELDYRLDLHSIYGQPWSWFNVDYIRQEHPGAQDPVRVLLEDTQTNDNAVGEEGYKERHILRKEHVDRGLSEPDVHMGDSFTPEEQVEWARQSRNRPQHDVGWNADDVYGHFHMRQYDRLLNLGRRRQAEARSFMSEYEKREALRYAYQAKERSADLLPGDAGTEEPAELTGAGMQSGGAVDSFGQLQSRSSQLTAMLQSQREALRVARLNMNQSGYDRMLARDSARRAHRSQVIAGSGDRPGVGSRPIARTRTSGVASDGNVLAAHAAQAQADAADTARFNAARQVRDAAQLTANHLGATNAEIRRRKREAGLLLNFARNADAPQTGGGAGFDHRGRSAQQQVIAGSGRPGAPPGWHYMSTGVMMRDAD